MTGYPGAAALRPLPKGLGRVTPAVNIAVARGESKEKERRLKRPSGERK